MDEFDYRGQVVALGALVTECATGHQQEGRAQAFAPRADDVAGHLAYQRHPRVKPLGDDLVHGPHVVGDQGKRGGGVGGVHGTGALKPVQGWRDYRETPDRCRRHRRLLCQ